MITGQIVSRERMPSIRDRALVMAVATVFERVSRLPAEDKSDLFEAAKIWVKATTREDQDAAERAMVEILELSSVHAGELCPESEESSTQGLTKWIEFVSRRIREMRQEKGLTQEKLASMAGLPQSHISRLESGQHSPSRKTLEKIASALGVEVGSFDPSA